MICPVCGGKSTGKVGIDQFYCWDCCIEYKKNDAELRVFDVAEDGSLVVWEEELSAPYM